MSMKKKHNGLWFTIEEDCSAKIVCEEYNKENDNITTIYKRSDGFFTPYFYKKKKDPQWELPIWCKVNSKVILPTLEDAKKYIKTHNKISSTDG